MKKFNLILLMLFVYSISAQSVVEATYLNIPASDINRFAELHKQITDMAQGEERTHEQQWVYKHWYGSGASVVIYDVYPSAEAAVKDDFFGALEKNVNKLSDDEQKKMNEVFNEWWAHFDGHWDELRNFDGVNHYATKSDVDWDIPFVWVLGAYNTKGQNPSEMVNAFMDWSIKPGVSEGNLLGGGATTHYKGSGYEAEFFSAYSDVNEFAKSISGAGSDNTEARSKFWSLVDGGHEDQIYIHVGHMIDGKFNFAGKDN